MVARVGHAATPNPPRLAFSTEAGMMAPFPKAIGESKMEFIVIWIGLAFITGLAANARGRSFVIWFIWGALFSLLALLAVLVMENKKLTRDR